MVPGANVEHSRIPLLMRQRSICTLDNRESKHLPDMKDGVLPQWRIRAYAAKVTLQRCGVLLMGDTPLHPCGLTVGITMKTPNHRTLVLMLCAADDEQPLFAGDLYHGDRLEDSVYFDQVAMLHWLQPLDPKAGSLAANAMHDLLAQPSRGLRTIPLGMA